MAETITATFNSLGQREVLVVVDEDSKAPEAFDGMCRMAATMIVLIEQAYAATNQDPKINVEDHFLGSVRLHAEKIRVGPLSCVLRFNGKMP